MASGVSAAKAVATIDVPRRSQPIPPPPLKYSRVDPCARRVK